MRYPPFSRGSAPGHATPSTCGYPIQSLQRLLAHLSLSAGRGNRQKGGVPSAVQSVDTHRRLVEQFRAFGLGVILA